MREPLLIDTRAHGVAAVPASVNRCSALWLDLVSGTLEIVQTRAQEGRCVLILSARSERARPLAARARDVLERMLLGERRKLIAYDMNVSVSLLTLTLKGSLKSFGLGCKAALVPSALVMLVHGARGPFAPIGTFIGDYSHEGRRITLVTHVFDDSVLRGLSPSQRAVMSLVANGRSCTEIAARRNRSCRTVINQVAAASRRLGISSRFDLLHYFATGAAHQPSGRLSSRAAISTECTPPLHSSQAKEWSPRLKCIERSSA